MRRDTTSRTGSHDAPAGGGRSAPHASVERAKRLATVVRDIAEKLRNARLRDDPDALRQVEAGLRDYALALEKQAGAPAKDTVAADIAPAAGPASPTAIGPGGLGYLMALTRDEEQEMEWGARNAS